MQMFCCNRCRKHGFQTLIPTAQICHNGTVTTAHTEVTSRCCCQFYICNHIIGQCAIENHFLHAGTNTDGIFLFQTSFCNFQVHVDTFLDECQIFHIYFFCHFQEICKCVLCDIKIFMCFFFGNIFFAVVQQHFAIFFRIYQIVVSVFRDGICTFCFVCCDTFNIELAAFQNFYSYKAFFYQFLTFLHMFGFYFCENFHGIVGISQQTSQYAGQFNTICASVGNLYAISVFKNVRADDHIQMCCRFFQQCTCSGNCQTNCYRFCTAHAGFHFSSDCFQCLFHIHL